MFRRSLFPIYRMGMEAGKRLFSSCHYDKPILFGPTFSVFFFGGAYTLFINNLCIAIYQKQEETQKELKELRKGLESGKKSF